MNDNVPLRRGKIESLQALRSIAFLAIFISHVYTDLGLIGGWGVSVFFILSGFVMVYSYYDKSLKTSIGESIKFSMKKIKRLYPLHVLMMFLASYFLVNNILHYPSLHKIIFCAFTEVVDAALIQSWFPHSDIYFSINSVAWYLSVSAFLYAVFPSILKMIRRHKKKRAAFEIIIGVIIIQFIIGFGVSYLEVPQKLSDNFAKWVYYIFPLYRLGDFIIGCNLGYIFLNSRRNFNLWLTTLAEIIIIALIVITLISQAFSVGIFAINGVTATAIYAVSSSCIIFLFACKNGIITHMITNKITVYIGNLSAYAFLIHIVMIKYIKIIYNHFIGNDPNNSVLLLIALFMTIIASEIYLKIENKIKDRIILRTKRRITI